MCAVCAGELTRLKQVKESLEEDSRGNHEVIEQLEATLKERDLQLAEMHRHFSAEREANQESALCLMKRNRRGETSKALPIHWVVVKGVHVEMYLLGPQHMCVWSRCLHSELELVSVLVWCESSSPVVEPVDGRPFWRR